MTQRRTNWLAARGLIGCVGLALIAAGCGSSTSSSAGSGGASPPAGASTPASGAYGTKAITIATASSAHGSYLTASGRALYLWVADSGDKSVCSGACAQAWPPLIVGSTPSAGSGVQSGDLGTTTRSDGSKQVTYKGHPLYWFIADKSSGQTSGQGSDNFGAKWWLVSPSGTAITTGAASSSGSGW